MKLSVVSEARCIIAEVVNSEVRNFDPQKLAEKWKMSFNAKKCKVIHYGKNNIRYKYKLDGCAIESVSEEKDLGAWIFCKIGRDGQNYQDKDAEHKSINSFLENSFSIISNKL